METVRNAQRRIKLQRKIEKYALSVSLDSILLVMERHAQIVLYTKYLMKTIDTVLTLTVKSTSKSYQRVSVLTVHRIKRHRVTKRNAKMLLADQGKSSCQLANVITATLISLQIKTIDVTVSNLFANPG
jgi:hypothetical protein